MTRSDVRIQIFEDDKIKITLNFLEGNDVDGWTILTLADNASGDATVTITVVEEGDEAVIPLSAKAMTVTSPNTLGQATYVWDLGTDSANVARHIGQAKISSLGSDLETRRSETFVIGVGKKVAT